jgi:hypothetical protein
VHLYVRSSGVRFASASSDVARSRALPPPSFRALLLFRAPDSSFALTSSSALFFRLGLSAFFFFFFGSSPSASVLFRLCTPMRLTFVSSIICAGRSSMARSAASKSSNCPSSSSESTDSLSDSPASSSSRSSWSGISSCSSVTSMSWWGSVMGGFGVEFSSSISGRRGSPGSWPASGRGELEV